MTPDLLRRRIAAGADMNEQMPLGGTTPLMWIATYNSDPEAVQVLIDAGANVNACNNYGGTALYGAIAGENGEAKPEIVRIILTAGAEIETRHDWGSTPLTGAIMRLRQNENPAPVIETVRVLLDAGADVNAAGWAEHLPLMLAVTCELPTVEVVKLLIDAGADVNACRDSYTVLMIAVVSSFKSRPSSPIPPFCTDTTEIVELLIEAGAEVNAQSKDGWTALMVAARWRTPEFVRVLIDAGADINMKNVKGQTTLMLAKEGRHAQSVELLIEAGAEE